MYTLKENVKIVLKRYGVIVTRETLARNQKLADMILDDPHYNAQYGHNIVKGEYHPTMKVAKIEKTEKTEESGTIVVNVKKKARKDQQPETSKPSASTSTEAATGGMTLNISEQGQPSLLKDSGQSKESAGAISQKKKPGA